MKILHHQIEPPLKSFWTLLRNWWSRSQLSSRNWAILTIIRIFSRVAKETLTKEREKEKKKERKKGREREGGRERGREGGRGRERQRESERENRI